MRTGNFRGVTANGIFDPLTTRAQSRRRRGISATAFPTTRFRPAGSTRIGAAWRISGRCRSARRLANNYIVTPIKRSNIHRGDGARGPSTVAHNTLVLSLFRGLGPDRDAGHLQRRHRRQRKQFRRDGHRCTATTWWQRGRAPFRPRTIGDFRYGYTQFNMALLPTTLTNPIWYPDPRTATPPTRTNLRRPSSA